MNDLIRVKNTSYDRYEELLLRRDNLRKEALLIESQYIKVFGDLILQVFQKTIDCIKKKKIIGYWQTFVNRGEVVNQNDLQEYLEKEMEGYNEQLKDMVDANEAVKSTGQITEAELLQVKKLYRRMAKQIHPDINPKTAEVPELMELWQRIVIAYGCNELKDLMELEVFVQRALEQMGVGKIEVEIPDIDDKIQKLEEEIKEIMETDPYQYKYLLEDAEAVEIKLSDLKEELQNYTEYEKQLDEVLKELMINGGGFVWQMN